jgi:hypothetical protein
MSADVQRTKRIKENKMQSPKLILALILALPAASALGAEGLAGLNVPLTIHEVAGVERKGDICSTGVPLPCGLLKEPRGIAVFSPGGRPVPAQFRVLERWREKGLGKGDLSVKWLLVTFLADVPKGGKAIYHLKAGKNPAPPKPVKVEKTGDGYQMGGLNFRKDFTAPFKLVLTDPEGKEITTKGQAIKWSVWEQGPVRACLRAESPTDHAGFGFIAWVYAYAGQNRSTGLTAGRWDMTVVLKNTPNKMIGPFYFKDFSVVWAPPEIKGAKDCLLGGEWGKTISSKLEAGKSTYLYQASDGTAKWAKFGRRWWNAIVMDWTKDKVRAKAGTPKFRGYKVFSGGEEKGAGNFAAGWGAISGGGSSALVAVHNFHQQYPKAMEVAPGKLVARLWPQYCKGYEGLHWLDDCQRKRHDLSFFLFSKPLSTADAEATDKTLDYPLLAHAPVDWYLQSGVIKKSPSKYPPKIFSGGVEKAQKGTGRNWVTFGGDISDRIRRRYHGASLRSFAVSGNPHKAYRLYRTAMHSAGMTPFWVDDYQYPRDKGMIRPGYCTPPRKTGKYRTGTWHHGYCAWNNQHFRCEELFDSWRIFGDPLALEAARDIGTFTRFYVDSRKDGGRIGETRVDALPLSNICEVYRITGEEVLLKSIRDYAAVCWKTVNKERGYYVPNTSVSSIVKRFGSKGADKPFMLAYLMTALRTYNELIGDERAFDQILGMADFILAESSLGPWGYSYEIPIDREKQKTYIAETRAKADKDGKHLSYGNLSWIMAWAHRHTGEPRFRKSCDGLNKKAYPYVDYNYLKYYPERPDKVPPAGIEDLAAEALGGGKVKLTWTSPAGKPVRYQVKWAEKPMVRRIRYPEQKDTHANWWAANNVKGEPKPKAGKQSMVVEGVTLGKRCFNIRSFDAESNRSGFSNMVEVEVR